MDNGELLKVFPLPKSIAEAFLSLARLEVADDYGDAMVRRVRLLCLLHLSCNAVFVGEKGRDMFNFMMEQSRDFVRRQATLEVCQW